MDGNGVSIPNPREAPDGSIIEEKLGFQFDRCCLPDVTQEQLFGDEIASFIDAALAGGNSSGAFCLFSLVFNVVIDMKSGHRCVERPDHIHFFFFTFNYIFGHSATFAPLRCSF